MALNIRNNETEDEELNEIAEHCTKLPVLDNRSAEEILYDENGLPS